MSNLPQIPDYPTQRCVPQNTAQLGSPAGSVGVTSAENFRSLDFSLTICLWQPNQVMAYCRFLGEYSVDWAGNGEGTGAGRCSTRPYHFGAS
jgi:hypothetical protein